MKKNTMKLDAFKKLIREAVREEVRDIIREELHQFGKYINSSPSQEKLLPKKSLSNFMDEPTPGGSTIDSLIRETAQSMNRDEYRTIINANSTMAPNFAPQPISQPSFYSTQNPIEANIEHINAPVPDFSDLMKVMKEKNMI